MTLQELKVFFSREKKMERDARACAAGRTDEN